MLGCFVTQRKLTYVPSFFLSILFILSLPLCLPFLPFILSLPLCLHFLPFIIPPTLLAFLSSFCKYYKYPFKDPLGTKDTGPG